MRIAIICSFFDAQSGYQEVVYARELHRRGHDVMVVTAFWGSRKSCDEGYRVVEVGALLRCRHTVVPRFRIREVLGTFDPEVVILCAPYQGTSYFALRHVPGTARVVAVFSDLRLWSLRGRDWVRSVLKNRWYRRVFEGADLLVPVTNETREILLELGGSAIQDKMLMTGLAFDVADYFFDATGKPEHELKQLATVTRIVESKPIKKWVDSVAPFLEANPDWCWVLGGFPESRYASGVRDYIESLDISHQIKTLPLMKAKAINRLYNESALAIWFIPSIGIQQSMGTGILPVLPRAMALEHLVEEGHNGVFYEALDDVPALLETAKAMLHREARRDRAEFNSRYSGERVVGALLGRAVGAAVDFE